MGRKKDAKLDQREVLYEVKGLCGVTLDMLVKREDALTAAANYTVFELNRNSGIKRVLRRA